MTKLIAIPLVLVGLTGCAGFAFSAAGTPVATIYTDAAVGGHATQNNVGKKKGEACATSILGLVTTGDAGIRAAADAGNVSQISAVDGTFFNILGIYSKYCTIVSGDAGDGGETREHVP